MTVLDNFATGKIENLLPLIETHGNRLTLVVGDIRKPEDCRKAVEGAEYVFHEAALGSVPRSINDPITSNDVNISGFLNMLVASRDAGVKRFIYAASSSTYGDSPTLPKVEDRIGKPLSPYAVTKYLPMNSMPIFSPRFMGWKPSGCAISMFLVAVRTPTARMLPSSSVREKLMRHEPPVINGDGTYSRDFTYIDNVIG